VIRECSDSDFEAIYEIINAAAQVYRGIIPDDRWKDPYMSKVELQREISAGVRFSGFEIDGELVAVMGIQDVKDVTLIRHAYTKPSAQRKGIGRKLLDELSSQTAKPILIGTWADSFWAINFYKKNGFKLTTPQEKEILLRKYWNIPERQVETSVVLSNIPVSSLLV
jgi:GNAT superfamily N-acetyltransferase